MVKNLTIAILTLLCGRLIFDNPAVCSQLQPCIWLQGFLKQEDARQQQQVEKLMQHIHVMQGKSEPGSTP